jgi:hypothetical protein
VAGLLFAKMSAVVHCPCVTYYTNIERFHAGIAGSVHGSVPDHARGQVGALDMDGPGSNDYLNDLNGTNYFVPAVGGQGAGLVLEIQIGNGDPQQDGKVVNVSVPSGMQGGGYAVGDKIYAPGYLLGGTAAVPFTISTVYDG